MEFLDKLMLLTYKLLEDTRYYTYYYLIIILKMADYLTTMYILNEMNRVKTLLGVSIDLAVEQNALARKIIETGGFTALLDTLFIVLFYMGFALFILNVLMAMTMIRYGDYSKYPVVVCVMNKIYVVLTLLLLYPVARNVYTMYEIVSWLRVMH